MYRGRGRGKKVLHTTLGTAVNNSANVKSIDLSNLRKPIETSLISLKQVLGLFETATDEVKNYISYECELIYECRTCRSIFRSLANFILHKREYCKSRFSGWCHDKGDNNVLLEPSQSRVGISPKKSVSPSTVPLKDNCQRSLAAVISKLEARQKSEEICTSVMEADLVEERLNLGQEISEDMRNANVAIQGIESSLAGVFQTLITDKEGGDEENLIKSEVMEIHSILNNDEVILGPDGKILSRPVKSISNATPNFNLICKICRQYFSTKKTLTQHIKYKHNKTKVVYLCPETGCKGSIFANTWSVFRHLYKVHRKTSAQVKKMRTMIQSNVLRRGQVTEKLTCYTSGDKGKTSSQQTLDEMNIEWMDSFECDNDLQMCGGCGKRFDRKAALNSHSQMCQQRLAICNSIKETHKPDEEKREEIPKLIIKNHKVVGSQKRKSPHIIRKTECQSWSSSNTTDDRETIRKSGESEAIKKVEHKINDTSVKIIEKLANDSETMENLTNASEIVGKKSKDIKTVDESKAHVESKTKEDNQDSDEMTLVIDIPEERDEVIIIDDKNDQNHNQQSSIYEPEMILVEKAQVVCVSDDEDQSIITLETKAAPFMDINERKCIPCNHFFETIDCLLKHMATHFKWFHFQCNECLFKSYDHTTLQSHLQKQHSIADFERYTIRLTHHEIIKNSVDFQPLFEDDNGERKARAAVCADPSVQKMIMEVIFGSIPGLHENHQRPVRNRIMPKKNDFVYEDDVQNFPAGKSVKSYSKKRKL